MVEHCGPGELGAAEAVVRLMYTAQLLEEERGDVDLLVKVRALRACMRLQ